MNYINNAEMQFFAIDGNEFGFDLSPIQTAIICKILGCKFNTNGTLTCFSDKTLMQFFEMNNNPLHLKEIE